MNINERDLSYQIVYNAVESIVTINKCGIIIGFNPSATKLFGFENYEVIGKNVHILVPQEHASYHDEYICRYVCTNKRHLEWEHSEINIQRKDKSIVSVVMTLTETIINNEQIFTSTMRMKQPVCIKDIAARALIDMCIDASVTMDIKCNIKYFNNAAEKMFGYSSCEVIGHNVHILMPSPYNENHDKYVCMYLQTNIKKVIGYDREFIAVRKDKSKFPIRLNVTEVYMDNLKLFTATICDISAHHVTQEILYQATRVKKDFLARMTHELRTPLNGIIGMSNILANMSLTEEQNDIVQTIVSSGEGLLETINNVLDFSKADACKLTLEHVQIDLREIVHQVMDMLVASARRKNLHLYVHMNETLCTKVFGDAIGIRQIYTNVVGNAIKFTECGAIHIIVTCMHLDDKTIMFHTEVRDTGIGISNADILFNPFVQADMSTTRKYGGTGLGLTISKSLVQGMHGDIGILPSSIGATIWFTMKLDKQVEEPQTQHKQQQTKVVVVTSDMCLSEKISMYLTAWKYTHIVVDVVTITTITRDVDVVFLCDTSNIQDVKRRNNDILTLFPNATLVDIKYLCDVEKDNVSKNWVSRPIKRDDLYKSLIREKIIDIPKICTIDQRTLSGLVLIVEDNLINQKVMKMYVKRLGFIADVANNGIEVLQKLQECMTYKLLLMDCHMPQMDGFTCTRIIRANEKINKNSPRILIVACTGGVSDEDRQHCIESGMDLFLTKPVRIHELTDVFKRAGLANMT